MQVEIDERLLPLVRRLADYQGRTEAEVLQEALVFYVQSLETLSGSLQPDSDIGAEIRSVFVPPRSPENLEELFSRADRWQRERGVEPLSEDEAMELANEELHAIRRERKASR